MALITPVLAPPKITEWDLMNPTPNDLMQLVGTDQISTDNHFDPAHVYQGLHHAQRVNHDQDDYMAPQMFVVDTIEDTSNTSIINNAMDVVEEKEEELNSLEKPSGLDSKPNNSTANVEGSELSKGNRFERFKLIGTTKEVNMKVLLEEVQRGASNNSILGVIEASEHHESCPFEDPTNTLFSQSNLHQNLTQSSDSNADPSFSNKTDQIPSMFQASTNNFDKLESKNMSEINGLHICNPNNFYSSKVETSSASQCQHIEDAPFEDSKLLKIDQNLFYMPQSTTIAPNNLHTGVSMKETLQSSEQMQFDWSKPGNVLFNNANQPMRCVQTNETRILPSTFECRTSRRDQNPNLVSLKPNRLNPRVRVRAEILAQLSKLKDDWCISDQFYSHVFGCTPSEASSSQMSNLIQRLSSSMTISDNTESDDDFDVDIWQDEMEETKLQIDFRMMKQKDVIDLQNQSETTCDNVKLKQNAIFDKIDESKLRVGLMDVEQNVDIFKEEEVIVEVQKNVAYSKIMKQNIAMIVEVEEARLKVGSETTSPETINYQINSTASQYIPFESKKRPTKPIRSQLMTSNSPSTYYNFESNVEYNCTSSPKTLSQSSSELEVEIVDWRSCSSSKMGLLDDNKSTPVTCKLLQDVSDRVAHDFSSTRLSENLESQNSVNENFYNAFYIQSSTSSIVSQDYSGFDTQTCNSINNKVIRESFEDDNTYPSSITDTNVTGCASQGSGGFERNRFDENREICYRRDVQFALTDDDISNSQSDIFEDMPNSIRDESKLPGTSIMARRASQEILDDNLCDTKNKNNTTHKLQEINFNKAAHKCFASDTSKTDKTNYSRYAEPKPIKLDAGRMALADNLFDSCSDIFENTPSISFRRNARVAGTSKNWNGGDKKTKLYKKTKITDYFTNAKKLKPVAKLEAPTKRLKQTTITVVKKKKKFCTPYKSQQIELDASYEVVQLLDAQCEDLERKLRGGSPKEVIFNILFRDGLCQLTKSSNDNKIGLPAGILVGVVWEVGNIGYYYWDADKEFTEALRNLFAYILSPDLQTRKICYDTKRLYKLLLAQTSWSCAEFWEVHDLCVGCWLLQPETPPTNFSVLLAMLEVTNPQKLVSSEPIFIACHMLPILSQACDILMALLEENSMVHLFLQVEMPVVHILAGMESRGIKIKASELSAVGYSLNQSILECEKKSHIAAGKSFNLNSPIQVRKVLYEDLKLDKDFRVKETPVLKVKSTCETTLQKLAEIHPLPTLILEYRRLQRIKSAHVDAVLKCINADTLWPNWDQTSSAVGRIICKAPNLQTVPNLGDVSRINLRGPFNADFGRVMLAIDFLHAETRVFAHLSQDEHLLEVARSSDGITNAIVEVIRALIYSTPPPKLAELLHMDIAGAKAAIEQFSAKFPKARAFCADVISRCRQQGYVTTLSGRRRRFPNINCSEYGPRVHSERQAVIFLIQGSVADICKSAMVIAQGALANAELGCGLVLQLHDGLVWDVPKERVREAAGVVLTSLGGADQFSRHLGVVSVPFPVRLRVGDNWGDLKPPGDLIVKD